METNYICVIGSLNYDFFIKTSREPLQGETMTANEVRFSCGGKGANQAYQLGRLNAPVKMLGAVGTDSYGQLSIDSLKSAGVDVSVMKTINTNTGLGFVTVVENGEVSAIIDKGANDYVTIDYIKENYDTVFQSSIIVLQLEIPKETVEYIINEAHDKDCIVVLNPAPTLPLDKEILKKVDYLIVNEVEASYYLETSMNEQELLERINDIRELVKRGIVLTLGSKGSYYVNKDVTRIPIEKSTPIDTTGAGDSYIGAFVYGLFNGFSEVESCHFGAKTSARTIEKYGRENMPEKIE